uniref:MIT domain-containing protein n=1 Tax=Globodera rostochiensis TaxID=31243 RepID=A0A914GXT3_GLORO
MEFEQAKLALWEAVNLDRSGLVKQAIEKYIGGIEALLLCLGEFDGPKKDALRQQVEQYMSRVETLKSRRTIKVEFLEQRRILEDSTGHSYESIFAKCLDDKLTEVAVEEPWLSSFHQVVNVVKFCELLVRNCPKLRRISLLTQPNVTMEQGLGKLGQSLRTKNIELAVTFEENMHDREIRFNNGWLVKMGRGLDIYKNVDKCSLGSYDFNLRPCKATLIEIFKTFDNPS